jgi:hypothetical protein
MGEITIFLVRSKQIILGTVLLDSMAVIIGIAIESDVIERSNITESDQSKSVSLNGSKDIGTTAGGK